MLSVGAYDLGMGSSRFGGEDLPHGLEPAHLAAFRAFRRSAGPADCALAGDPVASELGGTWSVGLARRVYRSEEGTIDIVPGPGSVGYVWQGTDGERVSGQTTIGLAADGGLGHVRSGRGERAMFVGVLPAGAADLRITDRWGTVFVAPVTDDDAYWIAIAHPVDARWRRADGTDRKMHGGSRRIHRLN